MISMLLKTKKFIPKEFHDTFFEINFLKLYQKGYRLILTDLDNTIVDYSEAVPNQKVIDKFKEIIEMGFEIVVISNNHTPRINTFVKDLNVEGLGNARKPLLIGLKKAVKLAEKEYLRSEIVLIGDQLMTDIWGANRFEAYSILVNPIKRKTEKWYTKVNRNLEVKMLKKIMVKEPRIYKVLQLDKRR